MRIRQLVFQFGRWVNFSPLRSKVIYYHDVSSSLESYTKMTTAMELYKNHIEIIRKEGFDLVSHITNRIGQIQICFDDGFRGIWDNQDYFLAQNICPTVFLSVELIGKPSYLGVEEVLYLQKRGFVFQSHGYSHKDLTSFTNEELVWELRESKKQLENILQRSVDEICFPIGYFSDEVICEARQAGYKKMYSSIPGNYSDDRTDGLIYRNLVQFSTPSEFKQIIYGGMNFLSCYYRKRHKR